MTRPALFDEALGAFQRGDLARARDIAARGARQSGSPDLHHLIGLIECRLGNIVAGIEWLRRALAADPSNIAFKVMLARALVDSGQAGEALALAGRPPGTSPPELALWQVRAEAADCAGDSEQALEAWGELCRAGVANWRAWANYGGGLVTAGRWPQAEAAFRRAMELEPNEPILRRGIAVALAGRGREDLAADELLQWVEQMPDDPENRILLARLLADLGRDDEATAQLNAALRRASGHDFRPSGEGLLAIAAGRDGLIQISLLLELARLLERTNRMDALRRLLDEAEAAGVSREQLAYPAAAVALRDGDAESARRLLECDRPHSDPLRGHWLMARVADALDDPATAFAEAEAMHDALPQADEWRARGAGYIASVRLFASALTPALAARLRPLDPPPGGSPVFLVGFPRSGTTLLDTFLMGHPDVAVLEEVPLLAQAEQLLGDRMKIADRDRDEVERARDVYLDAVERNLPSGFTGYVIDKLPLNMLTAVTINSFFPDARFIFAQRHPCDCVLSCFMQAFAINEPMACFLDLANAAAFYDAAMTAWSRSAELLGLNVHTLVYENLVTNPEATMRPLFEFLGLDWRAELLDHRSTAQARGAISTPSYAQVVQPLSNRPSGRWHRYRQQLEPVIPVLLPWAKRLGYAR